MGRKSWLGRTALFAVLLVSVATGLLVTMTARPALASSVDSLENGGSHSCAILSGAAWCWGYNNNGELGDGTTTSRTSPVAVSTSGVLSGVTLTRISAGENHTCALSSAGAVYCWGYNGNGRLGDGTTTSRTSPVAVSTSGVLSGVTIAEIWAANNHTCALSSAGVAYCWGYNGNGNLGDGTTTQRTSPVAVSTSGVLSGVTLSKIAGGDVHTCALSSAGAVYCWGYNGYGGLGDGTTTQRTSPVAVSTSGVLSGVTVSRISTGAYHTCAVSSAGVAYCWGYNGEGEVGDGTTTNRTSPVAVSTSGVLSGVTVTEIGSGNFHTCVLSSAGAAYCWGSNGLGPIGDGSTTNRSSPVAATASGVLSGITLTKIAGGDYHTCAASSTRVFCWGYNANGRLGDGTTTNRTTAVETSIPSPPDAPTGVSGVAGNTQVAVSWTAPSMGSGTLTGYTVTASPGGATCTSSSAATCTVTGLTNGTAYTFTVVATSTVGSSSASSASSAVTPYVAPGAPTSVSGVAGNTQVVVSWTAPSAGGTGGVTGYTATASPGGLTCTSSSATTCTVTGLTNGTAYTFTVVAANAYASSSASSASSSVTPYVVAGAPTGVSGVASNTQVVVSWTAPSSGGTGGVTGYTATASPGGAYLVQCDHVYGHGVDERDCVHLHGDRHQCVRQLQCQ